MLIVGKFVRKVVSKNLISIVVKFMFSKKATKNDEIFTVDLTLTTAGMYPQGRPVRPRSHLNFQIP